MQQKLHRNFYYVYDQELRKRYQFYKLFFCVIRIYLVDLN